LKVGLARGAKS